MSDAATVDTAALIQAIKDSGLSKAELARRSRVSLSHIKNICGGFLPRPRTAQALADALNVDIDTFYRHPDTNGNAA